MRKYTIIAIIIIGIILGFFTGIYLYKINQVNINKQDIGEKIEDERTEIEKLDKEERASLIKTNSKEEKTSPNCVITLKVYHEACEHIIETKKNIGEADVNLTEEELKERFSDWKIQKFTPTEIVLYKEVAEFCNEHYLLKDDNGYITIYKLDKNDNAKILNTTEIATGYLPEEDLNKFKTGVKVYTEKELNKILEDFE